MGKGNWIRKPKIKEIVSDDGVLSDGFLTRDSTVTITGKGQPGSKVVLFDNGVKIGVATVGDNGRWSIDTARLGDGDHQFTARAKFGDKTGKMSKPFKGTIDTKAPEKPAAPDLEPGSDSGLSSTDDITADRTPTLTGGAEAGSTVTIRDGSAVLGTTVANAAGKWSFTTAALADGAHGITIVATDKAGNDSPISAALVLRIDTEAAGVIALDPVTADNVINFVEGDPNCAGDIAITGTVTGEIPDGATVTLLVHDQTYTGTVTDGVFSILVRPVHLTGGADLQITASVTFTDDAGNIATVSDSHTYSLDFVGPGAPVITGFSEDTGTIGDSLTGDNELTITGTGEAGATITVFSGSTSGTTTVDANGEWEFTTGPLPEGFQFIIANQRDAAGNGSTTAAFSVTVDTEVTATITLGPVTEDNIINLREGDRYCAGDIPITGTVTGEIPEGATVTLLVNGETYTGTVASGEFSINVRPTDLTADEDLTISASVTVTDAAGNTDTITDTQTYAYDITRPELEITGFSEDTGTPGDHATTDNQLTFFGTADAGATIELSYSGAYGLIGQGVADANGDWTIDTTVALLTGNWNIYAKASNAVGNLNFDTFGMTILA